MQIFWNKKLSLPEISIANILSLPEILIVKTLSIPDIYTCYISHSIPRKQAGNFFPLAL